MPPESSGIDRSEGETIALRNPEGVIIATMEIQNIWTPDKAIEAAVPKYRWSAQ